MFTMGPPMWGGAEAGDPHAANVVALLHFDDANGTTLPVSSLGSPTIANSNTANHKVTTSQARFGSGSWNVTAGSNSGLSLQAVVPDGGSDYTLEFFYRPVNDAVTFGRIFAVSTSGFGNVMALSILDSEFRVADSTGTFNPTAVGLPLNTWYHFAICRNGGFTYFYVNGQQAFVSSAIGGGLSNATVSVGLGSSVGMNGSDGVGQFDEFRWTRFVARYPGGFAFAPPTAEFPNS